MAAKQFFKFPSLRKHSTASKKNETAATPQHSALTPPPTRRDHAIALGVIAALVIAMFGDLLFAGGSRVLGNAGADTYLQYVSWREFGFGELKKGNLALWNPHVFAGAPYFGGAQAALLYPVNFLTTIMPVVASINWSIAVNAFFFGAFFYAWMILRGLRPPSGVFAAVLAIFSGAHFMHVYSGQTAGLATMTWGPLIFLAIDGIFETRKLIWALLGMFAVAMQVFAGHPQYVFYTAIAAGLYSLCRLACGPKPGLGLMAGLASVYAGGILLSAVQLFTTVQAYGETIRSIPLPYEFAASSSLPPENLITLIAPNFFGDMVRLPYWGRCYLWEMSLYIGVTGFVLAVYGAVFGENRKGMRVAVVMIGILLLLALGDHTPLFSLLYYHVPGFNKFRCMAKFIYPATLFFIVLAAHGFDRLLVRRAVEPSFLISVFLFAGGLMLFGFWVRSTDWRPIMKWAMGSPESELPPQFFNSAGYMLRAQRFASNIMLITSATCLLLGLLLAALRKNRRLIFAVLGLSAMEVFLVDRDCRDTFDANTIIIPGIKQFLAEHPGDYRILNPVNSNSAMSIGAQDMWGSDPGVVRRYAEFAEWTQGGDPDQATQYVNFAKFDALYAMLRLRFAFVPDQTQMRIAEAPAAPLPRVLLVSKFRVIKQRDQIFLALRDSSFDPRKEVILESPPVPEPMESDGRASVLASRSDAQPKILPSRQLPTPMDSGESGTARVTECSTDYLAIEANLALPSILLITDLYTPAWRAVALQGSSQARYELLPANYILRAIPLGAGHHHLRVEYAPIEYRVGKWVSIFSWLAFAIAIGAVMRDSIKKRSDPPAHAGTCFSEAT